MTTKSFRYEIEVIIMLKKSIFEVIVQNSTLYKHCGSHNVDIKYKRKKSIECHHINPLLHELYRPMTIIARMQHRFFCRGDQSSVLKQV